MQPKKYFLKDDENTGMLILLLCARNILNQFYLKQVRNTITPTDSWVSSITYILQKFS